MERVQNTAVVHSRAHHRQMGRRHKKTDNGGSPLAAFPLLKSQGPVKT